MHKEPSAGLNALCYVATAISLSRDNDEEHLASAIAEGDSTKTTLRSAYLLQSKWDLETINTTLSFPSLL